MNRSIGTWSLGVGAIVLAWFPHPAFALDVVVAKGISVTDAQFGGEKLVVGRKLKITCGYGYASSYANKPGKKLQGWKVRLEVDGKTIADLDATIPGNFLAPYTFIATGNWTAAAAGNHVAKCVLDPDNKLAGMESSFNDRKNNSSEKTFIVDVVVPTFPGDLGLGKPKGPSAAVAAPGSSAPAPGRGFAAQAPGTAAQGPQAKIPDPDLVIALAAQVLPNCGPGQDVVRVSGTIKNIGGFAVIPPGKPIVKIESPAGVYGGNITMVGNLATGQMQQVSVSLKPKASPESLAGATLKLSASIIEGVIKETTYAGNEAKWGGNYQDLTVVFPPNYCKQAAGSPTAPRVPVVPMNPATPRQAPAAPAPQRPAPVRQ